MVWDQNSMTIVLLSPADKEVRPPKIFRMKNKIIILPNLL